MSAWLWTVIEQEIRLDLLRCQNLANPTAGAEIGTVVARRLCDDGSVVMAFSWTNTEGPQYDVGYLSPEEVKSLVFGAFSDDLDSAIAQLRRDRGARRGPWPS